MSAVVKAAQPHDHAACMAQLEAEHAAFEARIASCHAALNTLGAPSTQQLIARAILAEAVENGDTNSGW